MQADDRIKRLYESYRNPTKISVVVLLTEFNRMTVTQMAGHLPVGRPNLYRVVSEMVRDGILNEPEVKLRGNYVEKYYSLNEEMFRFTEPEEAEYISTLQADGVRDLVRSYLVGLAFNLNVLAEKVHSASDEEIMKLKESYLRHETITAYYLAESSRYAKVQKYLRLAKEELDREGDLQAGKGKSFLRVMLLAFPTL